MTNQLKIDDPRLMDYVLGELDSEEAKELERLLQAPENEAAREEVNLLNRLVSTATKALQSDASAQDAALPEDQRDRILTAARLQDKQTRRSLKYYRITAMAAMLLLCLGGIWLYTAVFAPEARVRQAMRKAEQEEIAALQQRMDRLDQQAEGWERFLVGDVNNPQYSGTSRNLDDPANRAELKEKLNRIEPELLGQERKDTGSSLQALSDNEAGRSLPSAAVRQESAAEDIHIRGAEGPREAAADTAVSPERPAAAAPKYPTEPRLTMMAPLSAPKSDVDAFSEQDGLTTLGYLGSGVSSPTPIPEVQTIQPVPGRNYYPGGEQYAVIEERPFARADESPLSTFSLHADSAAYTNIRRFLQQGQRPPRDAVRIEELINYFSYDYPQPTGRHPFSVNIEVGPCPWAQGHLLAKVGLQGRDIPKDERPAANLVFLIDTSGSMNQPNRLPLVKESLKALLEMLRPEDRVGIVTYAGQSLIALPSTPVAERSRIEQAIEGLNAGGSTHGSAGIQDAYAMAQTHFIKSGINRVILATDGDFNVGVTSRDGLLGLIEEKRRTGVFLTVLGYGMGNLKDGTLELLATKGNGNYAYIDTYSEARRMLVEQLTGTLTTIAKDVKIQVEFNPARVQSYRLLGYENRQLAHRDFHDDTKDAGEIGAGHTVTALYQIVPLGASLDPGVDNLRYQPTETPVPPAAENVGELMFVKLRYKQPDSESSELLEIPVPARSITLEESSADYRFAAAVAGFGLTLRDSAYKGSITLDLVRQLAASATGSDPRRAEFLDLVVTAKTLQ